MKPIQKILVPNRGEIAIRIFRACAELGIRTVAVYSYEDRFSLHRYKADEAYQVGVEGGPVAAYLDIDEVISVARKSGADAIHPGYGFLSEKVELRTAAEAAGIRFIGPSAQTLTIAGDKSQTRALAISAGVPVLPGSAILKDVASAKREAQTLGYPVILKSAFGGGGRGMRVVKVEAELENAFHEASAEAKGAFSRSELYLEKFVSRPKHIEVQLLGSGSEVVHLFERDCSIQRRHQKLIEIAPAVSLGEDTRRALHVAALKIGNALNLVSAATVEFLLDEDGSIYFIEVNPRIQVEHTVTEEITGIDLIQSQIQIASGKSMAELGITQENIQQLGCAIQCRVTTEDPEQNFAPDYGRLLHYRSASGFGIRLDAGSAFTGAVILPFYDSLLVKVTARGRELRDAASKLRRCLSEFRVRGVKTNILFLETLLKNEAFLSGDARTTFLEEHSEVFKAPARLDRANKLLAFLSEVLVNGHPEMPALVRPKCRVEHPEKELLSATAGQLDVVPEGWRTLLQKVGKQKFLEAVKNEKRLLITDTTLRDAHQSLLATRVRTFDMLLPAEVLASTCPELFSIEMWGGATFDVSYRYLREDPWERLAKLRARVPNILFQMLVRGANVVGYTSYPDNVVSGFIEEAKKAGIDIFRIFDCFNNLSQMQVAIDTVQKVGGIAEVCICYTGDVLDKNSKYNLKYYLTLAKELERAGADILCIKDMAGLLRPFAAEKLVSALREEISLPIHFHTHDTAGGQVASYLKASEAGVNIVDCALSSMSGTTSQPSLESVVASLAHTERDTGLKIENLASLSAYWEAARNFYAPFESDLKSPTGEVYLNEIPGGQYSNFRPQAESVGLGARWEELKKTYAAVDKALGGLIKVTPSSKVVGDFALFLLSNDLTMEEAKKKAETLNFPESVVQFFAGEIGEPYGGFDKEFQKKVLRGNVPEKVRPGDIMPPADFKAAKNQATQLLGREATMRDALSYLLYKKVFEGYAKFQINYGDMSMIPTMNYLYGLERGKEVVIDLEPGKRLYLSLIAISKPSVDGTRTVFFELNGQSRSIVVVDASVRSTVVQNQKADEKNENHIAAPLSGVLSEVLVKLGKVVKKNDLLFRVEAMKMQTGVHAPKAGTIKSVQLPSGAAVKSGDLVIEFE